MRSNRYVITDYEHYNFSVSQSRFEDNLQPNIVTIPPNSTVENTGSHHIAKTTIIGASIGAVVFIVVLSASLLLFFRRYLSLRKKRRLDESEASQHDYSQPALTNISTQEMANNSLWNIHRELVDSGRVELQNQHINELPLSVTPSPMEVPTPITPDQSLRVLRIGRSEQHTVSTRLTNASASSRGRLDLSTHTSPFRSLDSEPISVSRANVYKELPPIPDPTHESARFQALPAPSQFRGRSSSTSIATAKSSASSSVLALSWGEQSRQSSASTPLSESMQVSPLALRSGREDYYTRRRSRSESATNAAATAVTTATTAATTPYAMIFDYDIYRNKGPTRRQILNALTSEPWISH